MSDMDGNPHVDPLADAIIFSADDAPTQNIEFLLDNLTRATKAVAYEQRTANMQRERDSMLNWITHPEHRITSEGKVNLAKLHDQIEARLGIEPQKED